MQSFAYESHAIADGDPDAAAFGYDGQIVVLKNPGDLLTTTNFHKVVTRITGYIGSGPRSAGRFPT